MGLFSSPEIRVGIVGHRLNQLPELVRPRVAEVEDGVIGTVEEIGRAASRAPARFVLISAVAEGADRYAAHAALAHGWLLECPLPFSVKRYEQDFDTPESIAEFRALLKRARKVTPMAQNDKDNDAGYAAAGRAIVARSELLLCVWNGAPAKGPGGTAHVVAMALADGDPVLWMGVETGAPTRIILPSDKRARKDKRAAAMRGALAERFERVAPPAAIAALA